jgi:hypothetical protein
MQRACLQSTSSTAKRCADRKLETTIQATAVVAPQLVTQAAVAMVAPVVAEADVVDVEADVAASLDDSQPDPCVLELR